MAAYALADMLADFGKRPPQPLPTATPRDGAPAKPDAPPADMETLLAQERMRTEEAVSERLVGRA